jgi:hypothetical protein
MRALIITDDIRAAIAKMVAHAEAHPIPWSVMQAGAIRVDLLSTELKLADRPAGFERPASEHLLIPMGYRMAFSVEEQPAGFCHHLSVSVDAPGRLPSIPAVQEISDLCGIKQWHEVWLEEFGPGHNAVNILELYKPREEQKT